MEKKELLKLSYKLLDQKTIYNKYLGENHVTNLVQKAHLCETHKDLILWNKIQGATYYLIVVYDLNLEPQALPRILFYDLLSKENNEYGCFVGINPTPFKKLKKNQLTYMMIYALKNQIDVKNFHKEFNKLLYFNDVEQYLHNETIASDGLLFLGTQAFCDIDNKIIIPIDKIQEYYHPMVLYHDFIKGFKINKKLKDKNSVMSLNAKNINFFNGFENAQAIVPSLEWEKISEAKSYFVIFYSNAKLVNEQLFNNSPTGNNIKAIVVNQSKDPIIKFHEIILPNEHLFNLKQLNQAIDTFRIQIQKYLLVAVYATNLPYNELMKKMLTSKEELISIFSLVQGNIIASGALSFINKNEIK